MADKAIVRLRRRAGAIGPEEAGALDPGSVNAKVTVQGTAAAGVRFVRTTMRSVRIA
jgi:hypothetical protein